MTRIGTGVTLFIGGARSGKSDLVVKLGESWDGHVVFVATATAGDIDMAGRIRRHQHDRHVPYRAIDHADTTWRAGRMAGWCERSEMRMSRAMIT